MLPCVEGSGEEDSITDWSMFAMAASAISRFSAIDDLFGAQGTADFPQLIINLSSEIRTGFAL
jgi:hypothetical protein